MVSQISLEKIIAADWSKQYLSSAGQVESRGIGSRLIKWLSSVPLLSFVKTLFQRSAAAATADMHSASKNIKGVISELIAGGINADHESITQSVKKVNDLFTSIASKRTINDYESALIDVEKLNSEEADVVDDSSTGLPEVSRKQRMFNRQVVLAAKRMQAEKKDN